MRIKVFGKPDCEFCKTTLKKFETFSLRWGVREAVEIIFIDMETVDGLAEGAFHSVIKIPTTVIERDSQELARWDGKVPQSQEFKVHFEDLVGKGVIIEEEREAALA